MARVAAVWVVIALLAGSVPVVGQTPVTLGCATGGAVTDPVDNPGLVADCETLLAVRDTLAGTAVLDWSPTGRIESWTGITLGGTPPRVAWLVLENKSLTGSIPVQLGSLSGLQLLHLGRNQLTGSIPTQLGNLPNLTSLWLAANRLTGSIPTQLGNLSSLRYLALWSNDLAGSIPSELGNLPRLELLDLANNDLAGSIPSELGDLSNLTALYLRSNDLAGSIPSELGDLSNLTRLELAYNRLAGSIPSELGNLSNLTALSLFGNRLTGTIPTELGDLSSLTELNLSSNQFSGAIPTELGDLSSLTELNLSSNQFSGAIPTWLGDLSSLTELNLSSNQFSGAIPTWLGDLSSLTKLSLSSSRLTGGIPTELGNLSELTELSLRDNQLTGSIPTELVNLSNLRSLRLEENLLSGSIPAVLGSLTNLRFLALDTNDLTGDIPSELGNLSSLRNLYLANNQLTGCIPDGLRNVALNDFHRLGRSFCPPEIDPDSVTTLSNLTISPGTLSPPFESDVTAYTATVDAREFTVNPVSDHGATLQFLNEADAFLPDSNSGLDGHQIDLTGGAALVKIKVISQDGSAEGYYILEASPPETVPVDPPGPPSITTPIDSGPNTLTVAWSAPLQTGSVAITAYDLRYIETGADESLDTNWTLLKSVWTKRSGGLSYQLSGIGSETEYDIQVRAFNGAEGPWSSTTAATTTSAPVVNTAPLFRQSDPLMVTVEENTRAGVDIGVPIAATDSEDNVLIYTLGEKTPNPLGSPSRRVS